MFKYDQVLLAILIGVVIAIAAFAGFDRGFKTAVKLHEEASVTTSAGTTYSYSEDYEYSPPK